MYMCDRSDKMLYHKYIHVFADTLVYIYIYLSIYLSIPNCIPSNSIMWGPKNVLSAPFLDRINHIFSIPFSNLAIESGASHGLTLYRVNGEVLQPSVRVADDSSENL